MKRSNSGASAGSRLSPIQESVKAGLTERLVFSDLVRTSLSRHEDASLLRVIVSGKDGRLQSASVCEKAVKEVEVREGWRVAREKQHIELQPPVVVLLLAVPDLVAAAVQDHAPWGGKKGRSQKRGGGAMRAAPLGPQVELPEGPRNL